MPSRGIIPILQKFTKRFLFKLMNKNIKKASMIYTVRIYDHIYYHMLKQTGMRTNSCPKNVKKSLRKFLFCCCLYVYAQSQNSGLDPWQPNCGLSHRCTTQSLYSLCLLVFFLFQHSSASFESYSRPVSTTSVVFSPLI